MERLILSGLLVSFIGFLWFARKLARPALPLPPGPPALPVIGNALQIPLTHQWLKYAEWGKKYGEIIHISVFGQPIVILNAAQPISDLLDRRSAIYSDRPRMTMAGELCVPSIIDHASFTHMSDDLQGWICWEPSRMPLWESLPRLPQTYAGGIGPSRHGILAPNLEGSNYELPWPSLGIPGKFLFTYQAVSFPLGLLD